MVKVYAVVCKPTGKAYVGVTSGKLAKRFREHRCLAKSGKHHATQFSAEWAQYGAAAFEIITLQEIPAESGLIQKREAELYWLKRYEANGLLLNAVALSFNFRPEDTAKGVEAARHIAGNRWTPEANLKRSLAQLGIPKNHGAKISAAKRAKREQSMR